MADVAAENNAADPKAGGDEHYWCELLSGAKKSFETWKERCDKANENYANLKRLSTDKGSAREMQMLYANLEVLKPSIYARKPVPVCKSRFTDRKPVVRAASTLIERALTTSFDVERAHEVFKRVRDDLALYARGVLWVAYVTDGDINEPAARDAAPPEDAAPPATEIAAAPTVENFSERTEYLHVNRNDFLHEPVRTWQLVGWVARRSWLTEDQGKQRFGAKWTGIEYTDKGGDTDSEYQVKKTAEVWEIWHKTRNTVVWVHPAKKVLLDEKLPWLTLDGFFPCPQPAYGVCEPESLIPVPDYLFYSDQLEEVNTITARISALTEALRLKGFYSAGSEDLADAIETALKSTDDNAIMIPVPAVAALGPGAREAIIWLPIEIVANTILQLINVRKQQIEDIYAISGISDIMRGDTKATETATAQNIKAQYGSVRVRTRQEEMVRIADDTMNIAGEIMAENFQLETMLEMSQLETIVPQELIQQHKMLQQAKTQFAQQAQQSQAAAPPQPGQPPAPAQPPMPEPNWPQLPPLPKNAVAAEEVMSLLRNQRMRPFILQTASDSTIQANEDAEKQRRNEFATAVSGLLVSAGPIVKEAPEAIPLVGEMLRFVSGAYRAGREMEQVIDDMVEKLLEKASAPPAPPPPDPRIETLKLETQLKQQEHQFRMAEMQQQAQHDQRMAQMDERLKSLDLMLKQMTLQERRTQPQAVPTVAA